MLVREFCLHLILTGSTNGVTLLRGYIYVHVSYDPDIRSPALRRLCRWASEGNVSIAPCHLSYMAPAFTTTGLSPVRKQYPSLGTLIFKMRPFRRILAINGEYAVLIEAKSTLKIEDVREHLERLEKFKTFFPEYKERKVVGAVGGIIMEEDSDKYAYRNGLFVIGESGDAAVILNDTNFQPKVW